MPDLIGLLREGLWAEARQDWSAAAEVYARVVAQPVLQEDASRTWHGEPPRRVARRRGGPVWLQAAQRAQRAGQLAEAARWWQLASREALVPGIRSGAALQWAESLLAADQPEQAAPVLARVSRDPELVREPRDPVGTRLVGTSCEVLLARAREQGGDAVDRALEQDRDEELLAALNEGAPWKGVAWLGTGHSSGSPGPLTTRIRDLALRMGAVETVRALNRLLPPGDPAVDGESDGSQPAAVSPAGDRSQSSLAESATREPTDQSQAVLDRDVIRFPIVSSQGSAPSATEAASTLATACRWRAPTLGEERIFPMTGSLLPETPGWLLLAGAAIRCLEIETGATRWRIPLSEPLLWAGGDPATVVLATRSGVFGVNSQSGRLVWHRFAAETGLSPARRRYQVVGPRLLRLEPNQLEVVDLASGETQWSYPSETGALGQYWAIHGNWLAIQQTAPARILFFQLEDGYLRSVPLPAGHLWQADPQAVAAGQPAGLGRGTEGFHLLDLEQATVATVGAGPRWNELRKGYLPGDQPVSRDAYLAIRDQQWLSLRDPFSGRSLWRTALDRTPGDPAPQLAAVDGQVYVLSGSICSAWRATAEGVRLWSHPVLEELAHAAPAFACVDDVILVWNQRGADELRVECRDRRTGDLRFRWRLPGRPAANPVQVGDSTAVLLTTTHVALYQLQ